MTFRTWRKWLGILIIGLQWPLPLLAQWDEPVVVSGAEQAGFGGDFLDGDLLGVSAKLLPDGTLLLDRDGKRRGKRLSSERWLVLSFSEHQVKRVTRSLESKVTVVYENEVVVTKASDYSVPPAEVVVLPPSEFNENVARQLSPSAIESLLTTLASEIRPTPTIQSAIQLPSTKVETEPLSAPRSSTEGWLERYSPSEFCPDSPPTLAVRTSVAPDENAGNYWLVMSNERIEVSFEIEPTTARVTSFSVATVGASNGSDKSSTHETGESTMETAASTADSNQPEPTPSGILHPAGVKRPVQEQAGPLTKQASTSSYSVQPLSEYENSQKRRSMKKLKAFVKNCRNPFYGLPCCGFIDPVRFLNVMLSLSESSYRNDFPKNIIGIGSAEAFIEKCFSLMGGVNVKCYDRTVACGHYLPVIKAKFPNDIEKCLPGDCRSSILFAGYPQGYLGPVLAEFIRRGGGMLCTTVEGGLFGDMHEGYEDNPEILIKAIRDLIEKKNGEFFEVVLNEGSRISSSRTIIQFYNWPSNVKQLMLENPTLKDLCFDIDLKSVSNK